MWKTNREYREEFQEAHVTFHPQLELRNDENFHLPPSRTALTESHPLTKLPKTWNSFPCEVIKTTSKKSIFNKLLKKYLINKLSAVPDC